MTVFWVTLVWLVIAMGLLLVTLWARQSPHLGQLRPSRDLTEPEVPSLTLVLPVRNEATNIERCLAGLLAQTYPVEQMKIVVVDDNSTDGTVDLVRRIAQSDPRVQLMAAGPLPSGWIGKSHACWRGALAVPSEWLCFVDADTAAAPALLSSAVAFAQANAIDLLSLFPFMELGSFWERLILPGGILGYELVWSLRRVNDPAAKTATAIGQFILIRRHVYESVQGHAAVRADIVEDAMLACLVQQAGYRVVLMHGDDLIRVRMYTNLRQIGEGLSKNVIQRMTYVLPAVLGSMVILLLAWMPVVLPVWAWLNLRGYPSMIVKAVTLGLAFLGSIVTLSGCLLATTPFRISRWYGLLLPLGLTMAAAIILNSVYRLITGRTVWKGRVYSFRTGKE